MKSYKKIDKLDVLSFNSREEMGLAASDDIAQEIRRVLSKKEECNIIFAAAPSQNEVLEGLRVNQTIDFSRINAFHMDEYIGLDKDAPQGFGNFLKRALFGKREFQSVSYINGNADNLKDECNRYANLINTHPIDIVVMGIGENGHIAFNDPWVADFHDKEIIKKVELDQKCRMQQVNDGCFHSINDVPKYALSLTIPTLIKPHALFCIVPGTTKAEAVYNTLMGDISENCPASILRMHDCARLYLDQDSSKKL